MRKRGPKHIGRKGWTVHYGEPMPRSGHFWRSTWLSGPGIVWMSVFLLLPMLIIAAMSFAVRGPNGEIEWSFSLESYRRLAGYGVFGYDPVYLEILIRSLNVGLATGALCLLTGLPLAFFIAGLPRRLKSLALVLVIIPFWTNLLIRTYAWQILLSPDSWLVQPLMLLGLVEVEESLHPGWTAVMAAMVCDYLPFMVLPLYASVEKIDWELAEAARDLGANGWYSFRHAVLPQIEPGVVAGFILVFLPATGQFVIPDLLGGARTFLLGNVLQQEFSVSRDWPFGSAFATIAIAIVLAGLAIHAFFTRNQKDKAPLVM